ncbi:MAG: PAS domain-containing protein [Gammaproteobacteria bacterium]|jgi:PAS domain S-box-containing protein|nr:PAS domain-containing protein [Pseudomonadota bacterium]MBT7876603.1 PAS domain-containing protein [Gammaproteobacteria bacterium]MDG1231034.1 PAS domain-containing protein [Pseudomonadales bacterium]
MHSDGTALDKMIEVGDAFLDCFTVVDVSDEKRPCIYANRRFYEHTGYSVDEALGRNLSFLQGKETDPKAIDYIRLSLGANEAICIDIANYRRDGSTFMNRLVMLPITKYNQNFFISFQNILPGNISDFEQLPLSSNAEIQHILNNLLSKLMLGQDITGDVDLSIQSQDFVETFNEINHFCLNIESPQTQAGYNPFANE